MMRALILLLVLVTIMLVDAPDLVGWMTRSTAVDAVDAHNLWTRAAAEFDQGDDLGAARDLFMADVASAIVYEENPGGALEDVDSLINGVTPVQPLLSDAKRQEQERVIAEYSVPMPRELAAHVNRIRSVLERRARGNMDKAMDLERAGMHDDAAAMFLLAISFRAEVCIDAPTGLKTRALQSLKRRSIGEPDPSKLVETARLASILALYGFNPCDYEFASSQIRSALSVVGDSVERARLMRLTYAIAMTRRNTGLLTYGI